MIKIVNFKKNTYLIFGFIFIIFWLFPLWNMHNLAVINDGNSYLAGIEAVKISILDYHQWPQNNPWERGGMPHSHYLMSPISIRFWFFIIFETKTALSLYLLFSFTILFYGSYKIAGFYLRNNILKYTFAFLSVSNIALIFHLKAGHYIFLSFCYFPLVLYFLFKHRSVKFSGVFSGYLFGLMLDDDIGHMPAYSLLILGIFIIYFFLNSNNNNRKKLLYWIYFFILTSLCVVSYKLSVFYEFRDEFPRIWRMFYFSNISTLIKSYIIPYYDLLWTPWGTKVCPGTWENSVYIGLVAFIFIFYSFKNKLNIIHYIVIFLFLLQLGTSTFLPYGWLQNLPVFESHKCYNRVRIFNSFYLSFLIIYGFIYISKNKKNIIHDFKYYILFFILIERLLTAHLLMHNTHKKYADVNIFSKWDPAYENLHILEKYRNNKKFFNYTILPSYESIKLNIGTLRWGGNSFFYEPSEHTNEKYSGPHAINEKKYQGEFSVDGKVIEPNFWSPNVIVFNNLEIGKKLKFNMNPNRGWKLNNENLFEKHKVYEPNKEFIINIKETSIALKYDVPGKKRGIIVSFATFILLLVSVLLLVGINKFRTSKLIK